MSRRNRKHAPRLRGKRDLTGGRTPTQQELDWAIDVVDRLGVPFHEALIRATGEHLGRPASVLARHVLIGWTMANFEPSATAAYTVVAKDLLALTPGQRQQIGLPELPPNSAYDRIWEKADKVIAALDGGFDVTFDTTKVRVDLDWWVESMANAGIPAHLPRSRTRAVDGTAWETCGAFVTPHVEYDGHTPADTDEDVEKHLKKVAKTRQGLKGKVPMGADGRPIYTTDGDARAGHKSSNNKGKAGLYIGYEVHLGTQVRDFRYGGKPNQIVLGADVPNFITMAKLTPAGADRVAAVVPRLTAETVPAQGEPWAPGNAGQPLEAVLWDRGYSIQRYSCGNGALRAAGIGVVFDLSTNQRTLQDLHEYIDWIDGAAFSKHMPAELRDLPRISPDDNAELRAEKSAAFDRRALWRWTPRGSTADGLGRRWLCPFHAGRLRIAGRPALVANSGAPIVELADGVACCGGEGGTVSLSDDLFQLEQASGMLWGTTAHATVYGQRSQVENSNNLLKDKYVRLDRSYTKLRGLANRKFLLGFLLAGVNRRIAVAWEAKDSARPAHGARMAEFLEQRSGEPEPAAPTAAALRQRRSRAARRARAAELAPARSSRRGDTAPRVVATRQ